jgi:hypothetical protein
MAFDMFRRLLCLAVIPFALGACGDNDKGSGDTSAARQRVSVTISDKGCDPRALTVAKGKVAFDVTNSGSSSVTEFYVEKNGKTIGEVENVTAGSAKTLTVTLAQGSYNTRCPNGTETERGSLTVTDSASGGGTPTTANRGTGPGIGGYGGDSGNAGSDNGNNDGSTNGNGGGGSTQSPTPNITTAP